jgi:hypothetical protein
MTSETTTIESATKTNVSANSSTSVYGMRGAMDEDGTGDFTARVLLAVVFMSDDTFIDAFILSVLIHLT